MNQTTTPTDSTHDGFSEIWLSLREPVDHAARDISLTSQLASWACQKQNLRVVELGAGTGSNLRYLLPTLGHHQHWTVFDKDPELIGKLPDLLEPWAVENDCELRLVNADLKLQHARYSATINCKITDLARNLETIAADGMDLITASALLDLTSSQWLDKLAGLISDHQSACLFALNYDGLVHWQPELEADEAVTELLNQHQLSEKGFGKALGPAAGNYLAQRLQHLGRQTAVCASPWRIDSTLKGLQLAIVEGWAKAATEQAGGNTAITRIWEEARVNAINKGQSTLRVGHNDVLSLP